MSEEFDESNFTIICDKLCASDNDLASIIDRYGYPPLWKRPNSFETLVHFILEQQVSLASALSADTARKSFIADRRGIQGLLF